MIESLAAGTPVIAFRRGAVPEVIEHGRTGFIVDDVDEMVEALGQIDQIDPAECRRAAKERFGIERFVSAHEAPTAACSTRARAGRRAACRGRSCA